MPDFDIDFCQERRDEVIHYVQEKYGRDQVAQIITFGTLQARGVLRDVGRVLQMPYGQVDKLLQAGAAERLNPVTLRGARSKTSRGCRPRAMRDPVVRRAFDIAQRLEGLTRHASTHAAGIVIGDRPLTELVPLYRDPKSLMPVTQFNMKWVEPAGLVKFDFLGLKTLTVLDRAVKLVRRRGIDVDLSNLPLDDTKSYDMLARGDTVGVFQVESQGMRRALIDMRPTGSRTSSRWSRSTGRGRWRTFRPIARASMATKSPTTSIPMLEPILQRDLRRHHLPGTGDADRAGDGRLFARRKPTCCAAPWARRSARRWRRSASDFVSGASRAASIPAQAEHDFRSARAICRLRFQQEPRRGLRAGRRIRPPI